MRNPLSRAARKTAPIRRSTLGLSRLEDRVTPSLYVTSHLDGTTSNVVREYDINFNVVRTLVVPANSDGPARDLAVADGKVHVFNGTFAPQLSSYAVSTNTWNSYGAPGWDTVNNVSYGGIALGGNYAYVTDMATGPGPEQGVMQFELATGVSIRFAEDHSPIDVTVAPNGWIYTLDAFRTVRTYRPDTLAQIGQLVLPESILVNQGAAPIPQDYRAIAVDDQGQLFTADWGRTVARFWGDQVRAAIIAGGNNPANNPLGNLTDIDLSGGQLAVGSTNGKAALMHWTFANMFSVGLASGPIFLAYSDPLVAVNINRIDVNESDPVGHFTVSLTRPSALPVTMTWDAFGGTAVNGTDMVNGYGSLTFNPGETLKGFDVQILSDSIDEPTEYFYASLNNLSGAVYETITGVATLLDDDPTPTVSIADAAATEGKPGTKINMSFTVSLSAASGQAVSVDYETIGISADANDYVTTTGKVNFAPGERFKSVTVSVLGDNIHEADETFQVRLKNPVNTILGKNPATGTIVNDDPFPSLSLSTTGGGEATGKVDFTLALSHPSSQPITVFVSTVDQTASAGLDYTSMSAVPVTFAAGTTSKSVSVTVLDDNIDEPAETFKFEVRGVTGALLTSGTGTITDNDPAPTVSVGSGSAVEANGPVGFTLSLSNPSSTAITVYVSTSGGTATGNVDYTTLTKQAVTFAPLETSKVVTVALLDDNIDEPDESFGFQVRDVNGILLAGNVGFIVDDDPTPTVSLDPATASEDGGTISFTATLSNPSSSAITVYTSTISGTATGGSDYTVLTNVPLTFAAGETSRVISVALLEDNIDELDETFGLELRDANETLLASTTGTITDNDPTPTVSVGNASVVEGDSGTTALVFTLTLSNPSSSAVSVNYATSDGTAAAGSDYAAVSDTVTFAPGQTQATVAINVTGETWLEANETFTLTLSSLAGSVLATATGTIIDDDFAPIADAGPDLSGNEGASIAFDASGSSDADGDTLAYTWDFGDGTTGQGIAPTHVYADNGVYNVVLTVDDGRGGVSTDSLQVTVNNVAPTAGISGPTNGVRGQSRTFTFTANDSSPVDNAAAFTYQINWGDGLTQTVTGPATGVSVAHVFAASGNFTVSATARDKNNGTGPAATRSIAITAAALQGTDLIVGGTTGVDRITFKPTNTTGSLSVTIGGAIVGTFAPSGQIIVYAQAGNDTVEFQTLKSGATRTSVVRPYIFFGGDGNDILDGREADGPGVLLGEAGVDSIYGGDGRSILIGGAGADSLRGGAADEILIGGTTVHDTDLTALAAIRAEWARTDANYATRRAHLLGQSSGLNGSYLLDATRVGNDGAIDEMWGDNGQEWFFVSVGDKVNDKKTNEIITNV